MKLIKAINRKESGTPRISRYAYLVRVDDIETWYWPAENTLHVPKFPEMKYKTFFYRLYTTGSSQKQSFDSVGNLDERGFKQKFSGTHPGRSAEVADFAWKYNDEKFIVFIPDCGGQTVVLGTPHNPMILTVFHESSVSGRKFTFSLEQEMQDDYPYFFADFSLEEGSEISEDFVFVLADNNLQPILFNNNKLLEI